MDNLFNFDFLFSDSTNSNKLSKNQVNKKFDEFIKESFATYLYKSAIFKKYAKVYDQDSSFTNECADLYILSEQLYLNAIQKIKLPFDVKFNKSNNLYIFNLNDIHNDEFIFKDSGDGRIFRPKKQKYLCKIIALIFVKLYILIKGIYSTFNHNLTYQEFISSRRKSKALTQSPDTLQDIQSTELTQSTELPQSTELTQSTELPQTIEQQVGGGIFDNIRNFFTGNSEQDNESDNENVNEEDFYDKELNKDVESDNTTNDDDDDDNDDDDDDNDDDDNDDDDNDKEDEPIEKPMKKTKKIKYNNVFFAFINSIFAQDVKDNESKLTMELPASLEDFTKNLKDSGMFDILCDTDYIYNALKKNILFNKNSMNKVYETSPVILQKIKKIENELLSKYTSTLEEKDKQLQSTFQNLQKYNKLCAKLQTDFTTKDETRIYERIIKIVKNMFSDYTKYRNKLFNEIILKIFEFKEKIIKDDTGSIKEVKNNIIRIKDNITYKEVIKFSSNAKVIIYDLHINFFNSLAEIFELLNEKNVINKGSVSYQPPTEEKSLPETPQEESSLNDSEYESQFEKESLPESLPESQPESLPESLAEPEVETLPSPYDLNPLDTSLPSIIDKTEVVDESLPESTPMDFDKSLSKSQLEPETENTTELVNESLPDESIDLREQSNSLEVEPKLESEQPELRKGGKRKKYKKITKKNKKRKNKTKKFY